MLGATQRREMVEFRARVRRPVREGEGETRTSHHCRLQVTVGV